MGHWLQLILLVAGAYLVGAVPSGLLVSYAAGKNVLRHGSGKTGTANTLSLLGWRGAAVVFVLDLLKGLLVVLVARLLSWPSEELVGLAVALAGAAAIVGHNWSLWVRLLSERWGGGRGIMVAVGALLAVHPLIVLVAGLIGFITLRLRRGDVLLATLVAIGVGLLGAVGLVLLGWLNSWLLVACAAWGLLVAVGFWDSITQRKVPG